MYPAARAPTVLENDRVVVQQFTSAPGQWVGEHAHAGNQLAVVLDPGTVTYREGGKDTRTTYTDGEVVWVEATGAHDHAVTSDSAIDVVLVTLKASAMAGGAGASAQAYPNLEADVVFENEHVIVQRVVSEQGQWAGEHAHAGNQLTVVVNGGTVTYLEAGQETPRLYQEGYAFWVDATAAHDHAATADGPVVVVMITFKQ